MLVYYILETIHFLLGFLSIVVFVIYYVMRMGVARDNFIIVGIHTFISISTYISTFYNDIYIRRMCIYTKARVSVMIMIAPRCEADTPEEGRYSSI